MKFKVDENLPVEAADALRAAGHDSLTIHDQRMVGDPDPQIAAICQAEQRAILSLDLDFGDIRAYPPGEYYGIVVLRPRIQAKPTVLRLVTQLVPLLDSEPLAGNLWIIDESGLRIREGEAGQD